MPFPPPTDLEAMLEVEMLPFCAGCRVREAAFGRIITHPAFSVLHDANLVLLRRAPPGLSGADLEQLVRPIYQAIGTTHLRFLLLYPQQCRTLGEQLQALGYARTVYLIMQWKKAASKAPSNEITLHQALTPVGMIRIDQVETDLMREVAWNSPLIRAALRTRRREITEHLTLDWFWAEFRGTVAGSVGLLRSGPVASIQAVSTRPNFRGRGVASSMVLAMVERALRLGYTRISLMAEADDWPHTLYERLGFEAVARVESYLKDE